MLHLTSLKLIKWLHGVTTSVKIGRNFCRRQYQCAIDRALIPKEAQGLFARYLSQPVDLGPNNFWQKEPVTQKSEEESNTPRPPHSFIMRRP